MMGIYDRDYYRREGPSFLGSLSVQGRVCKWLIIINICMFVLQLATTRQPHFDDNGGLHVVRAAPLTDALDLNNDAVLRGEAWRLLTCAFLHDTATWMHIVFNMLFLWWFGSDVEDLYGPREFLSFYLVAALASSLSFVGWQLVRGEDHSALGASGAVTAVMVLYALHYPSRVIYIWFFLPVPIWLFVLFQVAQDSFIFLGGRQTTTAVTAHLGGAAFGFLYYTMNWRLLDLWTGLRLRSRSRPRLRIYREQPAEVLTVRPTEADIDEQLEAKVDVLLAKVARSGEGSLTDSERAVLLRASEVYKRKRT